MEREWKWFNTEGNI